MEAPDVTWMEDVLYPERRGTYLDVIPRDMINETLLHTDGDELLALCEHPRVAPSCNDAFWREKFARLDPKSLRIYFHEGLAPREAYAYAHNIKSYCINSGTTADHSTKCFTEAAYKGDLPQVNRLLRESRRDLIYPYAALYYAALHQDWDIVNLILAHQHRPGKVVGDAVTGAALSGNIDAVRAYASMLTIKPHRVDESGIPGEIKSTAAATGNLDMFRAISQLLPVDTDDNYWNVATTALVHGNYNILNYMNRSDPRVYRGILTTGEMLNGPEYVAHKLGVQEMTYYIFNDKLCTLYDPHDIYPHGRSVSGALIYHFPSGRALSPIVCKNPW